MINLKKHSGFSLIEMLISIVIYGTVVSGVVSYLVTNKRVNRQMDIETMMESNLRIGMDRIIGTMRNAGYGVPNAGLNQWIPWVAGFNNESIVITQGATPSDPDIISVASCTSQPVMTLTAARIIGETPLIVDDESFVDINNKKLIVIDESEFAHVNSVNNSTNTVVIDTDISTPLTNEGITRDYPIGTEICRVDVTSFDIDTVNNKLRRNENHGAGQQRLVDEIEDLQIVTLTAGLQYQVTLTARSNRRDPDTGLFPSRSLTSEVTLKN